MPAIPGGVGPSPPIVINGVQCYIYVGPDGESDGITEEYSLDEGPKATVYFKVPWQFRIGVIQGLLGTVSYQNGTIFRTDPLPYPINQSLVNVGAVFGDRWICTSTGTIRGIGFKTDQTGATTNTQVPGWGFYEWAVIPANFTVPLWQPDTFPPATPFVDPFAVSYVVSKFRMNGEVFAPPTGAFVYGSGNFMGKKLEDVTASQIRTRVEVSTTLMRMPIMPLTTFENYIGSVNAKPFPIAGFQFPKGAMLLTGVTAEPHADPCNFGIVQDIEIVYLCNAQTNGNNTPLDWNYFMDPSGQWVPIVQNTGQANAPGAFAYEDFSVLYSDTIS